MEKAFRGKGSTSQIDMAKSATKAGIPVSQPTINRIVNGTYGREPECLKKLCGYLEIKLNSFSIEPNPAASTSLMSALKLAWDGTTEGEQFLARVIRAAGRLGQSTNQRTV